VILAARAYTDAAELFANEELDFVDIATTPPTHRMMVELAAEHGVAAICQKAPRLGHGRRQSDGEGDGR
jgi:predicted dehydrogenase